MLSHLSPYLTKPEEECVGELLRALPWSEERAKTVESAAERLVLELRQNKKAGADLEAFFQYYSLDTKEGLALMTMAEALLRIPDEATSKALIRDKVAATNWLKAGASNKDWLAKAAASGLSLTSGTMNSIFSKLGEPVIRAAMMKAMRMLGKQFVIGEDIDKAMKAASRPENLPYRMTYDMLGEGARTMEDAERYYRDYEEALKDIAARAEDWDKRPGLCVKLSALHPRYVFVQKESCVPYLTEKLTYLCSIAAHHNLTLTVDAEEVDRLEISFEIIKGTIDMLQQKDWDGFGLAVQAYQKRALKFIDAVSDVAQDAQQKLQVRLVKGAYWDTEIKRAQVQGYGGYPVYTRKTNTDVSFLACAYKLLHAKNLTPLIGTHNAHTILAVKDMAQEAKTSVEFQKLFGMGNAVYRNLLAKEEMQVSIYAPVGVYEDLLPYLVRRLLENGANSSFVKNIYDADYAAAKLTEDPVRKAKANMPKHNPHIPLPEDIYGRRRKNSAGLNLSDAKTVDALHKNLNRLFRKSYWALPLIAGQKHQTNSSQTIINPANASDKVGIVSTAGDAEIEAAFSACQIGYSIWSARRAQQRAAVLQQIALLFEKYREELMALCVREAGKTLPDARDEIREAVDFCRYYAVQGEKLFTEDGRDLRGPTGESNVLKYESRGIFVCISPWNFPMAIFTGQIAAALMAGNAVIAKPAEQTPLIAARLIEIMIEAGVPKQALALLPGDGRVGAKIVQHEKVAGVAFTGSNEAAWSINQALASKRGPIVPLIAETGGQNAFIADSSALSEQVVDDVMRSAFGSTGQRCSAARFLFVQEEAAPKIIKMLRGAMQQLKVGEPEYLYTDIGPVIDEEAKAALQKHKTKLEGIGTKIAETPYPDVLNHQGHFFAPVAYEITEMAEIKKENFGPILHVIRFAAGDIDRIIDDINAAGYGLTLGVHSRIDKTIERIQARAKVGNIYVNRNIIGAVVGVQPFGGHGLSGTGPKAGGPDYLRAFATEKVISRDITASGGNASLVMLGG